MPCWLGVLSGVALTSNLVNGALRAALAATLKYLAPISALVLLCIAYTVPWGDRRLFYWMLVVIEVLTVLIILDVEVRKAGIFEAILSHRILAWIGSISYGLYLWHALVYAAIRELGYDDWRILITVGSAGTFCVAAASYYFVERPFLRLKKKLSSVTVRKMVNPDEVPPCFSSAG
jgi:peptidoglycan/LPS O-acetylase OafA/YrhL